MIKIHIFPNVFELNCLHQLIRHHFDAFLIIHSYHPPIQIGKCVLVKAPIFWIHVGHRCHFAKNYDVHQADFGVWFREIGGAAVFQFRLKIDQQLLECVEFLQGGFKWQLLAICIFLFIQGFNLSAPILEWDPSDELIELLFTDTIATSLLQLHHAFVCRESFRHIIQGGRAIQSLLVMTDKWYALDVLWAAFFLTELWQFFSCWTNCSLRSFVDIRWPSWPKSICFFIITFHAFNFL